MFPLFTNAAFLAGLAAVSAPILIHLLLRRKSVRVRFSTIQFFIKQDEQSMRKRKLRNLLLLAARVLLFILIVLAFARPYLPEGGATALANSRRIILLLDLSASMQANGPSGEQWERVQEMARQALSPLNANDRVALVPLPAVSPAIPEYVPPTIALRQLSDLRPACGLGDLAEGLQRALKLIEMNPQGRQTTLCILSDLQRSGCANLAAHPLPQEIEVRILDTGERFIPNAAVTDVKVDIQNPSLSQAMVTSFSDENYDAVPVEFKIDGKSLFKQSISLPAGAMTNVALTLPALAPGWHGAEFSLILKDGLTVDNKGFAAFFVPEPVHCLVVETRQEQRSYLEESFFVTTALNPARGTGTNTPALSQFVCEKAGLESLASRLSARQPRIDLVILPGVKQLASPMVQALRAYVEAGGGLMLFLGDEVSANNYNSELGGLLPAQIDRIEIRGEEDPAWRIAAFNKTSPCFFPFRAANSGNLYLPEFTRRFSLAPGADSLVAAEFDDEAPFMIQRPLGRGKVVLVNTTADTRWTDWQKHKTFVPWIQATAFYLAGRDSALQTGDVPVFVSGSEADLEWSTNQAAAKWQKEGGSEATLPPVPQGQSKSVFLDAPGIYHFRDAQGIELRCVAASLPAAESDLSCLAPADFQAQLVRRAEPAPRASAASLLGESSRGKELWRMLLLLALILMLIEPLAANRTIA